MCKMDPAWDFNKKKELTKDEFISATGELLKATRHGADIDHVYLDGDGQAAVIVYLDKRRLPQRVNIAMDSRIAIVKDLIQAIE